MSTMWSEDPEIVIAFAVIALFVIAVIFLFIYAKLHPKQDNFTPTFKTLSDGSVQMEFSGFGGAFQEKRIKRFHEQYQVGMVVEHEGQNYRIVQIQDHDVAGMVLDKVFVAYLERM
ncbi:hypothetical protein KIMH_11060 [Bombiscardovia apis]|uniref:DUF2500 domain-containing protein n=1 Tax=Bombiscardovia apis TaxID=2932182 RepID=A0ABM8BDL7_9BIFI|nr:hypothetical protein [Bombiscardovia apis]BDR54995.1 hypothetical protein KIMH_11060 [Bombiscardovia apis]